MRWYHGTSKQHAEKILKEGVLKPGEDSLYDVDVPRYDAVYITSEWQIAKYYSEEHGKDGVVLEIAANESKLMPDEDSIYDALHEGAVSLGGKKDRKLGQAIRDEWLKHWKSIGGEGDTFDEAWEAWGGVEAEGSSGISEEMKELTEEIHEKNPALSKAIIKASGKAAHIGPAKVVGIAKKAGRKTAIHPDADDHARMKQFRSGLHFPLTVYRAIDQNPDDIELNGIGSFWTVDEDCAMPHYDGEKLNNPTIVRAQVLEEDIDWEDTFYQNMRYGWSEQEVYLKRGKDIKLTGIKQSNGWEAPTQQYAIASKTAKKPEFIKTPGFVIEVPQERRQKFFVRPKAPLEYWAFKNRPRVFINEPLIFTFNGKPVAQAVVVRVEAPGKGEGEYKHWHKVYWKPTTFKKFKGAATKLYHGSRVQFKPGDILTPQPSGYVHDPDVAKIEGLMEKYRPEGSLPRKDSVYMVSTPKGVESAGGYDDYIYEVEPVGKVERNGLGWYGDVSVYGEYQPDDPEVVQAAKNYWAGKPHNKFLLWEYRAPKAKVVKLVSSKTASLLKSAKVKLPTFEEVTDKKTDTNNEFNLDYGSGVADIWEDRNLGNMKEYYDEIVPRLEALKFPLTVYRCFAMRFKGDKIDYSRLGSSWSLSSEAAKATVQDMFNSAEYEEYKTVTGKIASPDAVDWLNTVRAWMTLPEEQEIRMKPGATVKVQGKTRTAAGLDPDPNTDPDYYMVEGCGIWAVDYARKNGGDIYILSAERGEEWSEEIPYEVTHAFVKKNGKTFDVRGQRTPDKMAWELSMGEYSVKGPWTPDAFEARFMGSTDDKPLYGKSAALGDQHHHADDIPTPLHTVPQRPAVIDWYSDSPDVAGAEPRLVDIDPKTLLTDQATVSKSHLDKILAHIDKINEPTPSTSEEHSAHPLVLGTSEGDFIFDGNHRCAAALLKNLTIKVLYLDLTLIEDWVPEHYLGEEGESKSAASKLPKGWRVTVKGEKVSGSPYSYYWGHIWKDNQYYGACGVGSEYRDKAREAAIDWAWQASGQPRPKTADKIIDVGDGDEYWAGEGNAASGVLPVCPSKGTVCLAWRSQFVMSPGCWGTIGGAVQKGKSPQESAKIELKEEMGYAGGITLIPAYVFTDRGFSYHNFVGVVSNEFQMAPKPYTEKQLAWLEDSDAPDYQFNPGWETDHIVWVSYQEVVEDMKANSGDYHPGLLKLFQNSKDAIERALKISKTAGKLRAYHLSPHNITAFRPFSHFGTLKAAEDRDKEGFALGESYVSNPATIYEVDLDIKNPLTVPDLEVGKTTASHSVIRLADQLHYTVKKISAAERDKIIGAREAKGEAAGYAELAKVLKLHGYDGLKYVNKFEDPGSTSYVIVEASQAKIVRKFPKHAASKVAWQEIAVEEKDPKTKDPLKGNLLGGILQSDADLKAWADHELDLPPKRERQRRNFVKRFYGKKMAVIDDMRVFDRGKGWGTKIVSQFIEKAKAAGCDGVILQAGIFEQQEKGFDLVNWYEKLGFKTVGHSGELPLMVKWLKPQGKTAEEAELLKSPYVPEDEWQRIHKFLNSLEWRGRNPWYPAKYPWFCIRLFSDGWIASNDLAKETLAEGEDLASLKAYLSKFTKEYGSDLKALRTPAYKTIDMQTDALAKRGAFDPSWMKRWVEGDCWLFALALSHRMPNAEFVGLELRGVVHHVGLKRGDQYFDVRGQMDADEFNYGADADEPYEIVPMDYEQVMTDGEYPSWIGHEDEFNALPEMKQAEKAVSRVFGKGKFAAYYHGTNEDFKEFKSPEGVFYFTTNKRYAEFFADRAVERHGGDEDQKIVHEVDLDIKKPFDARKFKLKKLPMEEYAAALNVPEETFYQKTGDGASIKTFTKMPFWRWFRLNEKESKEALQKQGYDGIIQKENSAFYEGTGATSYVVFSPSQIHRTKYAASVMDARKPCPSGKRKFYDEISAIGPHKRWDPNTPPLRAYECPKCGFWHLTSKPQKYASRLPKFLYHGTPTANVPKILKQGLQPSASKSASKAVYLSGGEFTAENYAGMYAGEPYTLLKIDTSALDKAHFKPDDYELPDLWDDLPLSKKYDSPYDVPWELSLKYVDQVMYDAPIPAAAISVVKNMKNAAGEQTHMFPSSQDAKFKAWFDGSKVVDKNGNPMPVYHGTRSSVDFEEFAVDGPPQVENSYEGETTSSGSGSDPTAFLGAHFAEETRVANQFAEGTGWTKSRYEGEAEAPRVIQVFLRITNPKDFGSEHNLREFIYQGKVSEDELGIICRVETGFEPWEEEEDANSKVEEFYQKYDTDQACRTEQNRALLEDYRPQDGEDDMLRNAGYELAMQARHKLEQAGHDGVRYKNVVEGGHAWIAFAASQIKSVNAQQFNPRDFRYTASWAKKAAGFAFKSFKKLWHVGTMNPKDKRDDSYEGAGLSVSVNPEEWSIIAKLPGDLWELVKPSNRFVNFHFLSKPQRQRIVKWGIENGYAQPAELWRHSWYDDEIEDWRYSDYPTKEEAEAELGGGYEEEKVEPVKGGLNATPKLSQKSLRGKIEPIEVMDLLVTAYAEDELDCDGVWWADTLDPDNLSAPRGVIFPSKLKSWKVRKVQTAAVSKTAEYDANYPDDEEDDYDASPWIDPDEDPVGHYAHGSCWVYALAVHDLTGLPMVSISDPDTGPVHVAIKRGGKLLDSMGEFTLAQIGKRYGLSKPFTEAITERTVEEFYDVGEDELEHAKALARKQLKKLRIKTKKAAEWKKLPATDEWVEKAKLFLKDKWAERHKELGREGVPTDLKGACKFASMFAQKLFGGRMVGTAEHQMLKLSNGRMLDLTDAYNPNTFKHDKEFWMNPEHEQSLKSCEPRVQQWVDEFFQKFWQDYFKSTIR